MAEQPKESSSADLKDKSSMLDEEIGKEFLSSWKSMSMADDDAMDFSFDTVSKVKNNKFNFEKLDMDFNLDSDFDKISSFKVEMPDLDFTSPPKNSARSNVKKGESSGAKAGKQDGFNFSFDFNELDNFNLDSSLIKGGTTSNSSLKKKEGTADGNDCEGFKKPKPSDDENVCASNDNLAKKPPASERVETLEVETLAGNLGDLSSTQDGSVSKFSSSVYLDIIEDRTSDISKTINTEKMDQERDFPEKTKCTESKQQVINNAPSQSVGHNVLKQDTIPEQHAEVFPSGTKVIKILGDKQNICDNEAIYVDPDGEGLQLEHSSLLHITKSDNSDGEAIMLSSGTQARVADDPQPAKSDTSLEDNTTTGALKKISCDNDIRENKKSTLERPFSPASSETVVDKMMPMKDKELQRTQSKIFSRPEDNRPKHPSSMAGIKCISFGCKTIGDMHLRSILKARSNDTEFGSKLVSDSLPGSSELMRDAPALLGGKKDVKSCSIAREGIVSEGKPIGGKLTGNMLSFRKEVTKSRPKLLETGMSAKEVNMLSSQVNPSSITEETAQSTAQMSVNPQADVSGKESSQKARLTSIEGNKASFIKAGKITPALSSFKTVRNIGVNKVLTTLHQKETNSLVNSEQNVEIQGTTTLDGDHLIDSADSQKPLTPFLKRKSVEISEADLLSLRSVKRLSQSPSKSRSSKECSEEVVEQVESRPNHLLCNNPASGLESPSETKLMEVEIPDSVLMEDNGNVEKAEAYTKELEDICNMLKKKHEEAKELLVRAIVNDNNLLMLNHAVYEEKIQKVQKFASQLMSKRIQT